MDERANAVVGRCEKLARYRCGKAILLPTKRNIRPGAVRVALVGFIVE